MRSAFVFALYLPGMMFLHHAVIVFIEVIDLPAVGAALISNVVVGLGLNQKNRRSKEPQQMEET